MITLKTVAEVKAQLQPRKAQGAMIGFVPTMGYLHEGHLSLVRAAVKETDIPVVSIFVNPAQFGPQEDFQDYPRDLDRDLGLLAQEKVGVVFIPEKEDIYPPSYKTYVEVKELQDKLCGASRPVFFQGVCTVVLKLFHIVEPHVAYFGQKDAQQAIILKRMVRDLNLDIEIRVLPIVRDKDGLALSSRNVYLSPEERRAALCLSRSLRGAAEMVRSGERSARRLLRHIKETISREPLVKPDYIEIVDLEELEPVKTIHESALIALAAYVGKARLIDNTVIDTEETG